MRSINLQCIQTVASSAFGFCTALTGVKFGNKLESISHRAFSYCTSLERITIPLKDGLIYDCAAFLGCINLVRVDLVEEAILNETIAALYFEHWRNNMKVEINAINQILPNTSARGDEGFGKPKQYKGGLDQFFTKLFTTKHSIVMYWMRLLQHSSMLYLKIF